MVRMGTPPDEGLQGKYNVLSVFTSQSSGECFWNFHFAGLFTVLAKDEFSRILNKKVPGKNAREHLEGEIAVLL